MLNKFCGVCPCSLVMRHTDYEPMFCLVSTAYGYMANKQNKGSFLCGASQGNKGTRHKGTPLGYRVLKIKDLFPSHMDTGPNRSIFIWGQLEQSGIPEYYQPIYRSSNERDMHKTTMRCLQEGVMGTGYGTPPHRLVAVQQHLTELFGNRVISVYIDVEWPQGLLT